MRSRRARARVRGRHRTGHRYRGSSSSTCATKRSSACCRPALDLGVPEPVPFAALARTRLDPAARREPAARRGRHRGRGRTRVAARSDRGRGHPAYRRPRRGGRGLSIVPETAIAAHDGVRQRRDRRMPPRRLALVTRAACSSRSPIKRCTTSWPRLVRAHALGTRLASRRARSRVPITFDRRRRARSTSSRSTPGVASGCSSRRSRASPGHSSSARPSPSAVDRRPAAHRRRSRAPTTGWACAARRGAASPADPRPAPDRPTSAGACSGRARRTWASRSARVPKCPRRLGELHDRAVRFARRSGTLPSTPGR